MSAADINRLNVLSPEILTKLGRSYARALSYAGEHGEHSDTQEQIAEHILALAEDGELDEERISALAVIQTTAF